MNPAKALIKQFKLQPHVEGGYYAETYKSTVTIKVANNLRSINTAIYYLLESHDFSCWHRLESDEMWHYYCGSPLTLYQIDPLTGQLSQTLLGNPLEWEDACPQHLIPAKTWFAACVDTANSFALVGCTVAPGFDFADFTTGARLELLKQYPQHEKIICRFSKETHDAHV